MIENTLLWFNDQGDAINILPDSNSGIYNGTLNFDQNSSDTFKTIPLYLFEDIEPITFDSINNDTNLQKFQLFNENRFTFTGNAYFTQSVSSIVAVNNNPSFYSKWIYGVNFESKFPIGSSIVFNTPIFEFVNSLNTFTIIGTMKGAIMIISNMDNRTFTNLYGGLTFSNVTISGLNTIGIYDYKRELINQLSNWNEPNFYSNLYNDKKLTIINGQSITQSIVTVQNNNLFDRIYFNYNINELMYTQSSDLVVQLTLNSDLPNIYTGGLDIIGSLVYLTNPIPKILLPGTQFVINNSTLNTNPITIGNIPSFTGNINTIYYATQSQVIWNNIIYQSLIGYTQSATSSITPDNNSYWTSSISYLPSSTVLINEIILNATLHLTSNMFLFTQAYTVSNNITMAAFAQNYLADFNLFNINLTYDNGVLNSSLIYSSNYVTVNYLIGTISNIQLINEYIFQTEEVLNNYINTNVSSNFSYAIVITNIDTYGMVFLINGQQYVASADLIYNGLNIDQRKSIDRTLRNFLFNNFARLTSIGINVNLESSIYYGEFGFYQDTIIFTTQYPNVPLKLAINMGTNANYYVKNSSINFTDMGNYLNLTINGISYGQKVSSASQSIFIPDIPTTITNWVNMYYQTLYGYGILVSNVRNILNFNTSEPTTQLKYSIRTAKLPTPGISQYEITNYLTGNFGILLSGNEVVLSSDTTQDFETAGFSTGMIVAVNNTVYPYDNQEYNIIYLDSSKLGLSYQGPFWNTVGSTCSLSAFTTLAFSPLAYGVTACPIISSTSSGEFSVTEFDAGFSIYYSLTDYYESVTSNNLNINNTNLNDILYVNEFQKIYVGGYNISVVDANTFELLSVIQLSDNSGINKIIYNSYDKYIYTITSINIIVIDPTNDNIYCIIPGTYLDILTNPLNGDVYWTDGSNVNIINNYPINSYIYSIAIANCNKLEYNLIDGYIYVVANNVFAINPTNKSIIYNISIPSLYNNFIATEPIYGSIYVWGDQLYVITEGSVSSISLSNGSMYSKLIYDNFNGDLFLTQANSSFSNITSTNGIIYTVVFDYGDIVVSQYDSEIYMITNGGVLDIIDPNTGNIIYNKVIGFSCKRIIYNPLRESVIIMGVYGELVEIVVVLINTITLSTSVYTPSSIGDGLFGTLDPNYIPREYIWLKSRQHLRGPRANYSDDVQAQLVYKFIDDQTPQIFMYDISGTQLSTGTSYSYIGPKPLPNPYLNKVANMDISEIENSSVQQTIFSELIYNLDYIDSSTDISFLPTPVELFLGFNDNKEGYINTTLKMYYRESVSYSVVYNSIYNNDIILMDMGTSSVHINGYGIIQMNKMSSQSFIYDSQGNKTGLKEGQQIQMFVTDVTNTYNKYISYNNGKIFYINQIYNTQIVVDYIPTLNGMSASIVDENTIVYGYPTSNTNTYLKISFVVLDIELASINLYGQTEIEDIRYRIELYNSGGHNINPQDAYIFKTYDIEEQGIDWTFLNKKRKEMLMVRSQIFSYIGSYKAIINSINYFGYNDLQLYEYYRNININSPNFYKLFKIEIPDIFNNNTVGFTVEDFLKITMPNPNFEETNMFNLTYLITDKQGNNVLLYSLQEVITKLQGLKNWLQTNVIPITHKILDITGRTDFVGGTYIRHKSFSRKSFKIYETMTPIDFNINEAYLMPVNSGSTVYNVVIDFVASKQGTLPLNFEVFIRTYQTFQEWNPFTIYNMGDNVTYYEILYQSFINNNQLYDPRTYANVPSWDPTIVYFDGQITNYNRHIYEYLGTQSTFIQFGTVSIPTPAQTTSWLDISQWIVQDLKPVQTIIEQRTVAVLTYSCTSSNVLFYTSSVTPDYLVPSTPFNFSVDSNIDPYITVEVNSYNGTGLNYTSRKNYQIIGLNDLYAGTPIGAPIGPFIPIAPVI